MKKSIFILITILLALLFCSCVTNEDIYEKENKLKILGEDYEEAQEEYETISAEYDALIIELEDLELSLEALNEANETLLADNEESAAENEELSEQVPRAYFWCTVDEFYEQLSTVNDYSRLCDDYINKFGNVYSEDSLEDGYTQYFYVFEGDEDSESYVTVSFITGDEYDELYEIIISYSDSEYYENYSDLVELVATATVMLETSPYYYYNYYTEDAMNFLNDGTLYYEYIHIEQENTENTGTTRLYCDS